MWHVLDVSLRRTNIQIRLVLEHMWFQRRSQVSFQKACQICGLVLDQNLDHPHSLSVFKTCSLRAQSNYLHAIVILRSLVIKPRIWMIAAWRLQQDGKPSFIWFYADLLILNDTCIQLSLAAGTTYCYCFCDEVVVCCHQCISSFLRTFCLQCTTE